MLNLIPLTCLIFILQDTLSQKNIDETLHLYDVFTTQANLTGGSFYMGVLDPKSTVPGEYPPRKVSVEPFVIDRYPVAVAQFRRFTQTKRRFRTEAEIRGWSFVFYSHVHISASKIAEIEMDDAPWWLAVREARWNIPEGGDSDVSSRLEYPVTHVTANDAAAFCHWRGMRLPTEAEWEYASRGGLDRHQYPWGESYKRNRMNLWQGIFPSEDERWDNWHGVAPVDAYPSQNAYDMYDMLGNVWEWTSTKARADDWNGGGLRADNQRLVNIVKGGSFIDTKEGLVGPAVRCSTRHGLLPTISATHIGFRCAKSSAPEKRTKPRTHLFAEMHPIELENLESTRQKIFGSRDEL